MAAPASAWQSSKAASRPATAAGAAPIARRAGWETKPASRRPRPILRQARQQAVFGLLYTEAMTRRNLFAALGAFPLTAADIPRPVGDFEVTLPGGKKVKPSDYKGKVVAFACILTT